MFQYSTIAEEFDQAHQCIIKKSDTLTAIKALPSNFFQLIVSSPPYNIGKVYEKQIRLETYLEIQKEIIGELVRLLACNGSLVWQVGNYIENGEVFPLDMYFYPIFKSYNLQLRNRIIWHFGHGLHTKKRFSGRYETLLWFSKTEKYIFNLDSVRIPSKYPGKRHYKGAKKGQPSSNPLGKNPSDYWPLIAEEWEHGVMCIPNVKSNHPEKTEHPCQFPIELIERLILALTNKNDWVLDPFGGVGSSLIAALKHHRRGMTIDQEAQYIEIARQRVQDLYAGSLAIRPLGKPIHRPSGREKVAMLPQEWANSKTERRLF